MCVCVRVDAFESMNRDKHSIQTLKSTIISHSSVSGVVKTNRSLAHGSAIDIIFSLVRRSTIGDAIDKELRTLLHGRLELECSLLE